MLGFRLLGLLGQEQEHHLSDQQLLRLDVRPGESHALVAKESFTNTSHRPSLATKLVKALTGMATMSKFWSEAAAARLNGFRGNTA